MLSLAMDTTFFVPRPGCRYPRAYARGTWELKPEIQLYFARVDFLLKLNISFDNVFVDPNRRGEKTDGPKFVPPVYLLDSGKTLANFPTRVGFDLSNDVRYRILGGNHDHQVKIPAASCGAFRDVHQTNSAAHFEGFSGTGYTDE
jgi:hypothetical protein